MSFRGVSDVWLSPEAVEAAAQCMAAGQIDPGRNHEVFRALLAAEWGVPANWVTLVNSCTTAIRVAASYLDCANQFTWDVPALTWPGSYCELPDFDIVDTNEDGLLRNYLNLKEPSVFVDLYGRGALPSGGAPIIFDSAHRLQRKDLFHWLLAAPLRAACFSFGPTKQVTTLRGGAVVTPHPISERYVTRCAAGVGRSFNMDFEHVKGNLSMTEVGAAMGVVQMGTLEEDTKRRMELLEVYKDALQPLSDKLTLVTRPYTSSGHLCVIKLKGSRNADAVRSKLEIPTSLHYPMPYSKEVDPGEHWPVASNLSSRLITLPLSLHLAEWDVRNIVEHLKRVL